MQLSVTPSGNAQDNRVRAATQWSRADPEGSGSSAVGQLHDGQLELPATSLSSDADTLHESSATDPDKAMHSAIRWILMRSPRGRICRTPTIEASVLAPFNCLAAAALELAAAARQGLDSGCTQAPTKTQAILS